jgi:hypothetical protein
MDKETQMQTASHQKEHSSQHPEFLIGGEQQPMLKLTIV